MKCMLVQNGCVPSVFLIIYSGIDDTTVNHHHALNHMLPTLCTLMPTACTHMQQTPTATISPGTQLKVHCLIYTPEHIDVYYIFYYILSVYLSEYNPFLVQLQLQGKIIML